MTDKGSDLHCKSVNYQHNYSIAISEFYTSSHKLTRSLSLISPISLHVSSWHLLNWKKGGEIMLFICRLENKCLPLLSMDRIFCIPLLRWLLVCHSFHKSFYHICMSINCLFSYEKFIIICKKEL